MIIPMLHVLLVQCTCMTSEINDTTVNSVRQGPVMSIIKKIISSKAISDCLFQILICMKTGHSIIPICSSISRQMCFIQ